VRFPENIAELGVNLNVTFTHLPPQPAGGAPPVAPDRVFTLDMRPVDRLVVKLFQVAEVNSGCFDSLSLYAVALPHPTTRALGAQTMTATQHTEATQAAPRSAAFSASAGVSRQDRQHDTGAGSGRVLFRRVCSGRSVCRIRAEKRTHSRME
jgi:hypothetical protein